MKTIVMSLGGSLIVPGEIDHAFLKKFRKMILDFVKKGNKVILVCGGGKTCRNYNSALEKITKVTHFQLDQLGIKATELNAELVRQMFGKLAYKEIVPNFNTKGIKSKVIVGCGWKPGTSSDYDAVMWAKNYNADWVINLSNIDYVYDKDPRKHKDAIKLEKLSWEQMQKIVGTKWIPGLNAPFDPIATKIAGRLKLKVALLNGRKLKNIQNFLNGRKFVGSVVE
jgi:uridylate kinase